MAAAFIGGLLYWNVSYVSGEETCAVCGMQRDVDRRGPLWFVSEPYGTRFSARADPRPAECKAHEWKRTGCWQEEGGFAYYAHPRTP